MGTPASALVDFSAAPGLAPGGGRCTIAPTSRRLRCAIPFATILAATAGPGTALAQSCTGQCALQAADQEALLAPFNSLLFTPEGRALLDANLQKQNDIYLNATQADKIASGTILILPRVPANVLIRAFPGNPSYYYDAEGLPTAPALPPSIAGMVGSILGNIQIIAMKPFFGTQDTYGTRYGYLPGQTDSLGNPPPYQVSTAILNNPFTPANSSTLAWQNQQTPGAYGINWQLGDSKTGDFPSAHTMLATINAIPFAILAPGYYQQLAMSVVNFSYDLNVFAVHYPTDVIGGRILGTYVIAKMLANDPLYASPIFNATNLPALSVDMQAYLGGGGGAALSGSGGSDIGYSTLGGRLAASYVPPNGMVLTPRISAAWQHGFGPATPTEALAFASTGAPFTVAGLPIARDAALLEGGLDLQINPQARLGLSYSSQLGSHVQRDSVQGNLVWQF